MKLNKYKKIQFVGISLISAALALVAYANHSWDGYHWSRTASPFVLELGDNVSASWDSYLARTASDWSSSTVLDAIVKTGRTKARTCKPTVGRVEICNEKYGSNGWLGIAQVWVSGEHITQGTVKMNDSYFTTNTYNKPAWKNLVMCQEVGHTLGLDHQDENFSNTNLGTCMDYTNDPDGTIYGQLNNEHPNFHDYEELRAIYNRLDNANSFFSSNNSPGKPGNSSKDANLEDSSEWGKLIKSNAKGKGSLFAREFNKEERVFTFVIWAE